MRKASYFVIAGGLLGGVIGSTLIAGDAFAGITDGDGATNSRTTRVEHHYDVDLTNNQSFTVPDEMYSFAKSAIWKAINAGKEESEQRDVTTNDETCGYIDGDGWHGEAEPYDFCFNYRSEGDIEFYADRIPENVEIKRDALMFRGTVFIGVTVAGNSGVVLVGNPDDLDGSYTAATYEYEDRIFYFDTISFGDGYAIIDGADQEHEIDSGTDLVVHATGSFEDDFDHIEVDGEVVEEANHDAEPGSVIVTLHSDYLDSLGEGEHTLKFVYNGGEVETTFKNVKDNPDTADLPIETFIVFGSCLVLGATSMAYMVNKKSRR